MTRYLLPILLLAGCTADDDAGVPPDAMTGDEGLTLENCETDIADDVPAFYQKYFRCSTITVEGGSVVLSSSSLPPHDTYYYGAGDPNYVAWDTTRGDADAPNPHTLSPRPFSVAIPTNPTPKGVTIDESMVDGVAGTQPAFELPGGPIGMALDGVALFDGLAAPGANIETEKYTFDLYNAHPAPDETYHYHTTMPGSLEVLASLGLVTTTTPGDAEVEVYGIQCDGTVILGCTELDGASPAGALDAQGGHVADLVDDDGTTHFTARYHTHVCPGGHEFTPEIQYYTTCPRP